LVKWNFTKSKYPVFAKQNNPFLVKLLSLERRFIETSNLLIETSNLLEKGLIQKYVLLVKLFF
jgi:hypothetical protein